MNEITFAPFGYAALPPATKMSGESFVAPPSPMFCVKFTMAFLSMTILSPPSTRAVPPMLSVAPPLICRPAALPELLFLMTPPVIVNVLPLTLRTPSEYFVLLPRISPPVMTNVPRLVPTAWL